jgi:hypothetical protein
VSQEYPALTSSITRAILSQIYETDKPGENTPLTPEEKQRAHAALDQLPNRPHPWDHELPVDQREITVHPTDVGFKRPEQMHLGGASKYGKGWSKVEHLPIDKINYGQPYVPKAGIRAYIDNINKNPELPELAHGWGQPGEYHVISGHTRLSAQALAGRDKIPAKVYYYEPRRNRQGRMQNMQIRAPK